MIIDNIICFVIDDPPVLTLNQPETSKHNISALSNRLNDDKSLDPQLLQCSAMNEGRHTETLITYDEFRCKSNNGEYLHDIELIDGTRHKEEGIVINGHFTIRGFFFSKDDAKVISIPCLSKFEIILSLFSVLSHLY